MRRVALVLALASGAAAAHGILPQPLSVTVQPGAGGSLLVSTTFGAVVTADRGGSWRWICDEAIGYGDGQRPTWWRSATGAMFAGSFKGLFVARGDGCTWEALPDFEATGCADLQGAGATVLAVSGKYGVENKIWRSADDGVSWAATAEKSSTLFYTSVRLAPSNPSRVYAAAWWFTPAASLLLRSDDNGLSFTRADVSAALPAAGPFYVLAVHPSRPEVLFASVIKDSEPRSAWLLRSADSGATFTAVITTSEVFSSVAFGADPAVVYAAAGNTLYRSEDEGLSFTPLSVPQKNACVATFGPHVYSCGLQELDGWAVGQGDGGDFSPLLRWSGISGPISCPAGTPVQALCEPLWPIVKASFPREADAGIPDAGLAPPPAPKGCGCATVDGPLWLAIVLFLRRRARPY